MPANEHKERTLQIMLRSAKRPLNQAQRLIRIKLSHGLCGRLDSPKPQEICLGAFNAFSGWVFDQKGRPITGVEVFHGNKLLGVCDYGLKRDDVYTAHPRYPQAKKSGFFGWVFIPPNTGKTLRLHSVDEKGKRHMFAGIQLPRRTRSELCRDKNLQPANNASGQILKNTCLPSNIPTQILIAGMAKTGTTALFFKISNSLTSCEEAASKTKLLFEPTTYSGPDNERVLAKIIIQEKTSLTIWGENSCFRWVNFNDFKKFNKKILLLRDPRDRLISTLLYSAQGPVFRSNTENIDFFLGLLEKKERDPGSVSLLELIAARLRSRNHSLQTWKNSLSGNLEYFLEFRRKQNDFFYYKYEDFVQGKTEALEGFLGFPLSGDAVVVKALDRVVRTKKSGDWQNWFLDEDICFFKPVFQAFMHELGYEGSWSLPDRQIILPSHSSEYVRKNLPPQNEK
jgi:hypothetical protein